MAEDLFDGNGLTVTKFSGGEKRGVCLQITDAKLNYSFIQLTKADITAILPVLREFVSGKQHTLTNETIDHNDDHDETTNRLPK